VTERTSEPVPTALQSMPLYFPGPASNGTLNHSSLSAQIVKFTQPLISNAAYRFANLSADVAVRQTIHSDMTKQQGGPYGRT
jgi:hypothetical protein